MDFFLPMHPPVIPDITLCNRVMTCRRPGSLLRPLLPQRHPSNGVLATTHINQHPNPPNTHPHNNTPARRKSPIALHPRQKTVPSPSSPSTEPLVSPSLAQKAKPISAPEHPHPPTWQTGSGAPKSLAQALLLPILARPNLLSLGTAFCSRVHRRDLTSLFFTRTSQPENAESSSFCSHHSLLHQTDLGLRKASSDSLRKNQQSQQKHTDETSSACATLEQSEYAERFLPLGGGRGAE
jgi:hypothetical protein